MMNIEEAVRVLDEVIPKPGNAMVDIAHFRIAEAWQIIREQCVKIPNTPTLRDIGLSIRAYNALRRGHIHTVSDLVMLSEDRITKLYGVGELTEKEIINKIAEIKASNRDSTVSA